MTIGDPLLAALADAAQHKHRADHQIRLLLAYARELTQPRPYRLADLADAAGMSISGIRAAYTPGDVQHAARLLDGTALRHLQAQRNYVLERLAAWPGVKVNPPQGTYVVFPDVRSLGEDSERLCQQLR